MTTALLVLALLTAAPDAEAKGSPVILDFHAEWCGPCRQMQPELDELARKNYPIRSIDIDEDPDSAARYKVTEVPTFIVVDAKGRALARTKGYQPAGQLAALYQQVKAKSALPVSQSPAVEEPDESDEAAKPSKEGPNPDPWETVVRIRVHANNAIGFGSGTIIYSDEDQSVILTCAHIFHTDGVRNQPQPKQFPHRIEIDLFDGKLTGPRKQKVTPIGTVAGKALDYDFTSDVGLIVIRPGRKLPVSKVVPVTWQPRASMKMTTVGCSEGRDATAWSTQITRPSILAAQTVIRPGYDAIECFHAPKQGRSGGGLYTPDGYVAGVCDFADPHNNRGLYATPKAIYRMLDRNSLTVCYQPTKTKPGTQLAKGRGPARNAGAAGVLRAQNDDAEDPKVIPMPRPEIVGVRTPEPVAQDDEPAPARATKTRSTWRPAEEVASKRSGQASRDRVVERPVTTDLKIDPSTDVELLPPAPAADEEDEDGREPAKERSSRWRPVASR
jgi:thiol-disulfide isomerase/thioredoxin